MDKDRQAESASIFDGQLLLQLSLCKLHFQGVGLREPAWPDSSVSLWRPELDAPVLSRLKPG